MPFDRVFHNTRSGAAVSVVGEERRDRGYTRSRAGRAPRWSLLGPAGADMCRPLSRGGLALANCGAEFTRPGHDICTRVSQSDINRRQGSPLDVSAHTNPSDAGGLQS